ncbi:MULTISPECIES: 16S rRNA (adenine(1518)-N(6)/adenine(1519)-N(6))-dimethyltransferase RsmA [Methylobacterium]|uniref:16S rRNA (adenine(1518)-N(6)/adenine(1519)-N(6))- dimethyltransferase RsmA n=1 Tax=Methylobacterium TaxID=407 RepID=UPI00036D5ED8|nr:MULTISPECIES: 16S rRNA (adenine(1518)-N(6)/adenine(1519)-N(6))-dimethyltransferase RsmA [Methylobacterium]MBN4094042.1 16S rRNA (adenine(1518)-N(6)/adenine(1519)-N(6))-dimethyltransferase RsmA [Methylobacterium sp. OT2]UIN33522.1 16S rRNA (adenine(1518)-N(6)/adenine(1519)-N(6))-dimethyltransferase RsmA [Methylobacterium oryzae]SFS48298.1 16S rRNA (adenine1518-N6/adenine1519-N6)-dimethyltransferase [Methylobacterium sp. yr668]
MSAGDGLPPLREVVARHGLEPKKALGQNFLYDLNLTGRIARAAGPLAGVTVVEVGPGPGGLTRALLAEGAARVVAIERDPRALPALAEIAAHYPGRLEVVDADALAFDPRPLVGEAPARIVANLPYNVGTALLTGWLDGEVWPPWWDLAVLMFQREVAERIVAGPEERADYGRLGVLCGWRTEAEILFDVSPSAFVPPPKVTSSVVRLVPRAQPLPCRAGALEAVTRAAFGQRRKMLRQSLKALTPEAGALLAAAGLSETARAEEIPVSGFVDLANRWDAHRKAGAPVRTPA